MKKMSNFRYKKVEQGAKRENGFDHLNLGYEWLLKTEEYRRNSMATRVSMLKGTLNISGVKATLQ